MQRKVVCVGVSVGGTGANGIYCGDRTLGAVGKGKG